ncbi:MAG: general secretion pathway protein GspB [Gammaproteobacteria bacterium]
MSILSEAWRRVHSGDRRLAETLGAPAVAYRQRAPLLPWLLCLLLAALAAGLGVYVWLVQSRPAESGTRVGSVASSPQRKPAAQPYRHADLQAVEKPKVVAAAPAVSAPARAVSGESSRARPAAKKVGAAVLAHAPASAGNSADGEGSVQQEPEQASAEPTPPAAPIAFASAPDDVRERFPALGIVAHVWNPDANASFIVIGGSQYRAGDEIAPGVRLIKITRGGEVVAFRGYRLILQ